MIERSHRSSAVEANLANFVKIAQSQGQQKQEANFQINNQGNLVVSKTRHGAAAIITKLAAKIDNLFGSTRLSSALRAPSADREAKAADSFLKSINFAARQAGVTTVDRGELKFQNTSSYKELLNDIAQNNKPLQNVINKQLAGEFKIGATSGAGAKNILLDLGINIRSVPPQNILNLSQIYNGIVDDLVVKSEVPVTKEQVVQEVKTNIEFLKGMAKTENIGQKIFEQNHSMMNCFKDMFVAHARNNPGQLAASTMKLCCMHNEFMHNNADQLGFGPGSDQSQILLKRAFEQSFNTIRAQTDHSDIGKLSNFLQGIAAPYSSPVSHAANEAIQNFGRQDADNRINQDVFANYKENSKVANAADLTNIDIIGELQKFVTVNITSNAAPVAEIAVGDRLAVPSAIDLRDSVENFVNGGAAPQQMTGIHQYQIRI